MKPRFFLFLPLLAAGLLPALAGCDSAEDLPPDDELIVGAWTAEEVSVLVDTPIGNVPVDVLEALEAGDRLTISFDAEGDFDLVLDVEEPRTYEIEQAGIEITLDDASLGGTYSVESDGQVRFTVAWVDGEALPESVMGDIDYDFDGENRLSFSVENTAEGRALIAFLLGNEALAELVAGGEVEFRRQQ